MVSLLRIVECAEGKILVDGADISKIGLRKLRRGVAVIPQDPILCEYFDLHLPLLKLGIAFLNTSYDFSQWHDSEQPRSFQSIS